MIELKGKSLNLRTMTIKENRALWRKYEPEAGAYTYDEEKVDLQFEKDCEREDLKQIAGIFSKSDEVIGQLAFTHIIFSEKRCDVELFIATESHRNKGFGTEALSLAKTYAKDKLGVTRIYAEVSSKNERMQRVLEKCDFRHNRTGRRLLADGGLPMTYVCIL